jgi:hypothetical protein
METQTQSEKYHIITCEGRLHLPDLNIVLAKLPMEFFFAQDITDPQALFNYQSTHHKGQMEVYHVASVIALFPEDGERLACATVTDFDFPLRTDNIMDDGLGLRCCFHPKLESFDLGHLANDFLDEIEIDVHKFPYKSRDRRYEKLQ